MKNLPAYCTPASLARRSHVARGVVLRLVAQNLLAPDALVEFGATFQPVFAPEKMAVVLKNARLPNYTKTI